MTPADRLTTAPALDGTDRQAALATLAGIRAWVLDVDGCLMRTAKAGGAGGEAMPGAADLVNYLHGRGDRVLICTNASQQPPRVYAAHLREHGIDVPDEDFVTAGSAAADYISIHHPGARVLAVGGAGITASLRATGHEIADPHETGSTAGTIADVVLVAADDAYTSAQLNAAALAVDAGALLYTTVDVPWFHGGIHKSLVVSGAVAHAIGWAAGVMPTVLGKPSPALGEALLHRIGAASGAAASGAGPAAASTVAVVGDAIVETQLARSMGATSVLVLTGSTTPEKLAQRTGADVPDLSLPSVADLNALLTTQSTTVS
ncbi:HAD-IIA family hydrolase [Sinomonas sp. P10A9]|uniref:HAD-IIA family hydrolase n=1 Tax=Sinomonas puerhi TaxID=3238584 RepID=A0AB39L2T6_9MICC